MAKNSKASLSSHISSPFEISTNAFSGIYEVTLYVPDGTISSYQTADQWERFVNVVGIPGSEPGDLNGDGRLSVSDITGLIDAILSGNAEILDNPYADVNGDGRINIHDVTALIEKMLSV